MTAAGAVGVVLQGQATKRALGVFAGWAGAELEAGQVVGQTGPGARHGTVVAAPRLGARGASARPPGGGPSAGRWFARLTDVAAIAISFGFAPQAHFFLVAEARGRLRANPLPAHADRPRNAFLP